MVTINLPEDTVKTCIDIESKQLNLPIDNLIAKINTNKSAVKSMWANPKTLGSFIEWNYYDLYINKINIGTCKNAEKDSTTLRLPLKYWRLYLGFHDKEDQSFIVPGFIRFFSKTTKSFVPIEYLKKTDLLVDYMNKDIKMVKKEELTDYNIEGKKYYSFLVSTDAQSDSNPYESQFYLNGILAAASYYNFEKCF